jgi:hypothetical protein
MARHIFKLKASQQRKKLSSQAGSTGIYGSKKKKFKIYNLKGIMDYY